MEFEEWANVTTNMVSIFIKQSHIISLVTEEYYQPKKENIISLVTYYVLSS